MLVPYNSDAPLYHYPIATVGLIVVNVLLFFCWPPYEASPEQIDRHFSQRPPPNMSSEEMTEDQIEQTVEQMIADLPDEIAHPDWRMLHFGNGIRPWQWVTANFMNAGVLHLLGNMLFLWGLGIVVEGKIGWWRFLAVYLLIGTIGYGFVQVVMLWADFGNALGASLPIYGIMVLALLWAPFNELNCFLMLGVRPMLIDVPIFYFAGGYLGLQAIFFLFSGMNMGSEALHLAGAFVALPLGVFMLKRKLVDCEDWDVFSVWAGRHELTRDERRQVDEKTPEFAAKVEHKRDAALAQVQQIVDEQKNPALAWAAHLRMQQRYPDWHLPEETARKIIQLFHQRGEHAAAIPAMTEYLRRFPGEQSIDMRLALAKRMILEGERPRQGLKLLAKLDGLTLSDAQQQAREKLAALAEQRKEQIDFEEQAEDW